MQSIMTIGLDIAKWMSANGADNEVAERETAKLSSGYVRHGSRAF